MKEMTLQEIQAVSLDILKDVHDFCVKNNIRYTLYGGTMIGAIRHHGFIPWDDDVDIAMPRPDYERFISSYKSSNNYRLFKGGTKDCILAFSRVCDMNQTLVEVKEMPWTNLKTGIWIDIFPVDGVSNSMFLVRLQFVLCKLLWLVCSNARSALSSISHYSNSSKKMKLYIKRILLNNCILNANSLTKFYVACCKRIKWGTTCHVANLAYMGYGFKEFQVYDDFRDYVLCDFAGEKLYVIAGYDHSLRLKYGDYMQLPPEEKRNANHPLQSYYWKEENNI